MRRALPLAVLAVALVATSARAGEARLWIGARADVGYDSNVLATTVFEEDDWVLRLSPRFDVRDQQGPLQWRVYYRPTYELYREFDQLDGWNHDALARVSWSPTERLSFSLEERYIEVSSLDSLSSVEAPGEPPVVEPFRQGIERNLLTFETRYLLEPQRSLSLRVTQTTNDFEDEQRVDSDVTRASLALTERLRPTDLAGLGLSYTVQTAKPQGRDEFDTRFLNLFATWVHDFDPTFKLVLNAGPTLVDRDRVQRNFELTVRRFPLVRTADGRLAQIEASSCPQLDDGRRFLDETCEPISEGLIVSPELTELVALRVEDDADSGSDLTYFAELSLRKEWSWGHAEVGYTRDAATAEAVSIRDTVYGTAVWRATPRLRLTASAAWSQRELAGQQSSFARVVQGTTLAGVGDVAESVGIVTVDSKERTLNQTYRIQLEARYRFTDEITGFVTAHWRRQVNESRIRNDFSSDRLLVFVGFEYVYGPIGLPI